MQGITEGMTYESAFTVISLYDNCIGYQENCPYIELFLLKRLQSKCSDWFPNALSLQRECPYIECPCKEETLYQEGAMPRTEMG